MPIRISEQTAKKGFVEKVKEISGQNVYMCFQCGTCAGACPISDQSDHVPRKVLRLAQLGLEDQVAASNTCWNCASCYNCTVNCPRGIDIARVMEAIRLLTLRRNIDHVHPSKVPVEVIKAAPQIAMVSCFRKMTG